MGRLIDTDKAKEVLTKLLYETALNNSGGASLMCEDIAENRLETWFGLVPTVDAAEVVRCKDCKWYEESIYPELRPNRFCNRLTNNKGVHIEYKWAGNDFCSYGERRQDETD